MAVIFIETYAHAAHQPKFRPGVDDAGDKKEEGVAVPRPEEQQEKNVSEITEVVLPFLLVTLSCEFS